MMTDSEETDIERCSSIKSAPECFDIVPETIDFKFKFFGNQCSKAGTKIVFPLKEGKELPYHTKTVTKKGTGMLSFRTRNLVNSGYSSLGNQFFQVSRSFRDWI